MGRKSRDMSTVVVNDPNCPTCQGRIRETTGMVCQTCGTDYAPDRATTLLGSSITMGAEGWRNALEMWWFGFLAAVVLASLLKDHDVEQPLRTAIGIVVVVGLLARMSVVARRIDESGDA